MTEQKVESFRLPVSLKLCTYSYELSEAVTLTSHDLAKCGACIYTYNSLVMYNKVQLHS